MAIIALAISVLSIIMSNIVPLFQKQPTDYMNDISQQLSNIEIQLADIEDILKDNYNMTDSDLSKILDNLEKIEETIQSYQDENADSNLKAILKELSEIKQMLPDSEK